MWIGRTGRVGKKTRGKQLNFDIRPNTTNGGTISVASVSGTTSFATLLANNDGSGDLFTASKSGKTHFVIDNAGRVGIGTSSATITEASSRFTVQGNDSVGVYFGGVNEGNGQTGLFLKRTGATPSRWVNYIPTGSTSLSWYNDATLMTLTTEGNLTITGQCDDASAGVTCADYAEVYIKDENEVLQAGDLIALSSNEKKVRKADQGSRNKIIGVFSTAPGSLIGHRKGVHLGSGSVDELDPDEVPVALTGRVPLKVSTENGNIQIGDALSPSSTPGVAMKATTPGLVVGRAMQNYSEEVVGTIITFVNVSWYDPDVQLADTGYLTLTPAVDENFEVKRDGRTIDRIGAFSDLVVARIKSGYFETGKFVVTGSMTVKNLTSETLASTLGNFSQLTAGFLTAAGANISELTTNSLVIATEGFTIAGQNIRDYIYSITTEAISNSGNTKTAVISPLSEEQDGKIAIKLNDNQGKSKFEIKNASDSAVASFDSTGNATFSGKLSANQLSISENLDASDASISGTLRAGRIIANQIELSEEALLSLLNLEPQSSTPSSYLVNNYYIYSPSATESALNNQSQQENQQLATYPYFFNASDSGVFENLFAKTATFEQGLMAFGPASFFEASIADRLFVGSQLSLADRSINVLGGNLELQPLKQGGIAFVGGEVEIDTDGNLRVNGNANFAKNVEINGKLFANILSPLPGKNLVLDLGNRNQESDDQIQNSEFRIQNSSDSAILTINRSGDLSASGSGSFSKLNLNIVNEAQALSPTEVIATGSAGTAQIQPNRNELTIKNPLVTEKSLIYITPKTSISTQSLYLLRQVPENPRIAGIEGSFTVGISQPVNKKIPFNWILIN